MLSSGTAPLSTNCRASSVEGNERMTHRQGNRLRCAKLRPKSEAAPERSRGRRVSKRSRRSQALRRRRATKPSAEARHHQRVGLGLGDRRRERQFDLQHRRSAAALAIDQLEREVAGRAGVGGRRRDRRGRPRVEPEIEAAARRDRPGTAVPSSDLRPAPA